MKKLHVVVQHQEDSNRLFYRIVSSFYIRIDKLGKIWHGVRPVITYIIDSLNTNISVNAPVAIALQKAEVLQHQEVPAMPTRTRNKTKSIEGQICTCCLSL